MATLNEFIKRIENAERAIDAQAERELSKAGIDLIALVSQRVIQSGETDTGGSYSSYSNNPVPAYLYYNKSRNSSAEQRVRGLAKKRQLLSYREFRVLNGLNVNFKNFEFTGSMWRNIRVIETQKKGNVYTVLIKASNTADQKKLDVLSDKEGKSIIKPSRSEIQFVETNLSNWILNALKAK